ncbi:MAG: TauD/TfdA family dioxygenase, partial [Gammaproteobacteria bacterium]|nr:TauD/TfdA family dioxygenase [Gammaproteobacteria bacterium]
LEAVRRAWAEHLVLLFRGQHLSEEQHIAFSRQIGPIEPPNRTS